MQCLERNSLHRANIADVCDHPYFATLYVSILKTVERADGRARDWERVVMKNYPGKVLSLINDIRVLIV
jgi:hypothetical protein